MPTSVVITTYNDAQYLRSAVDSVLNGTQRPAEIIVVDDGSDDCRAESVVREYFSHNPTIVYYRQDNGGPAAARNAGLRLASQEYIAFLDADDVWLPENLELKQTLLSQCSSDYFGVYGSYIFSNTGKAADFAATDGLPPIERIGVAGGFPGGAPSYLFRLSALSSVGGFDEELSVGEDFDVILRLLAAGWKCRGVVDACFVRNMRGDSLTRGTSGRDRYEAFTVFLHKAERESLLPAVEIERRRKLNALQLAVSLRASSVRWAQVAEVLDLAFSHSRPRGVSQVLAYAWCKVCLATCAVRRRCDLRG